MLITGPITDTHCLYLYNNKILLISKSFHQHGERN